MSDFALKGTPNVPDYNEDGNSPDNSGGAVASYSYTLASAGDEVLVKLVIDNAAGTGQVITLSVDGATSYSYEMTSAGTDSDGAADFDLANLQGATDSVVAWLYLYTLPNGDVGVTATVGAGRYNNSAPTLVGGACDATTPVSGFTVGGSGGNVDVTDAQVWRL